MPEGSRRSRAGSGRKPVANVLGAVLARYHLTGGVTRARVLVAWKRAAGPALARGTRAIALRDGVLVIETQDSVAANFLTLQRGTFLARLREILGPGAPNDLRFQAGVLTPEDAPGEEPPSPPLPDPDPARVEALSAQAPEEIADSVRRAAAALLAVREQRLRDGWAPCPTCGSLAREGHCPPCRELMETPSVQAAASRLECNPDLALEEASELYPGATPEALACARELALGSLERQMERLLADSLRSPEEGGFEYLTYLRVLANAYLALRLERPAADITSRSYRELPERVYHVLTGVSGESGSGRI